MKWMVLSLLVLLTASIALADEGRVLKVFVYRAKKADQSKITPFSRFNIDDVELVMPNDEEIQEAKRAIRNLDIKPEDLKEIGRGIPLETFVLEVKKAYGDQPVNQDDLINGIAVMKPTEEELDQQTDLLKQIQDVRDFLKNFEFQIALGGAPALSPQLGSSYHLGDSVNLGLGYQFTPFFDTIVAFEAHDFLPQPAIANGGFEYTAIFGELLFKFRLTPDGVRPYFFFGPAGGNNQFGASFTYKSFSGNVNYQSNANFAMVGGLGFEIPLSPVSHFFLQAEVIYDFLDSDSVNLGSLDQTSIYLPIEIGVLFGK